MTSPPGRTSAPARARGGRVRAARDAESPGRGSRAAGRGSGRDSGRRGGGPRGCGRTLAPGAASWREVAKSPAAGRARGTCPAAARRGVRWRCGGAGLAGASGRRCESAGAAGERRGLRGLLRSAGAAGAAGAASRPPSGFLVLGTRVSRGECTSAVLPTEPESPRGRARSRRTSLRLELRTLAGGRPVDT